MKNLKYKKIKKINMNRKIKVIKENKKFLRIFMMMVNKII